MQNGELGLPCLAAAAEVFAACCRYQIWIDDEIKLSNLGDDGWLYLLDAREANDQRCIAAMNTFRRTGSAAQLYKEFSEVADFLGTRHLVHEIERQTR